MCGIAGYWDSRGRGGPIREMTRALRHRGPDDEGIWLEPRGEVALGHTRLAILDPTARAHQPMVSASGRYVITFNGEIYNYRELGIPALPGDTETLLAAMERWGVEAAVPKLDGMFAFAVWDQRERVLFLVRDRMGEKPLYYARAGGLFVFASELKALREHPGWDREIDRDSLVSLMRHNYIPAPHTIYQSVSKLPPASVLRVDEQSERLTRYWQPVVSANGSDPDALAERLTDSVRSRMISDVPVGAFLSGGVDSSLVVATMRELTNAPVRTFTLGFTEPRFDESGYARRVAEYLGCEHSELIVTEREAADVIPRLPSLYDEPFADSSQIPTYLLARFARESVKVTLSGDGADELFGGYERYQWAEKLHRAPRALLRLGTKLLIGSAEKRERMISIAAEREPMALYRRLISNWQEPQEIVAGGRERSPAPAVASSSYLRAMMRFDRDYYLPDDILVKLDRASMSVGLECRAPFLAPALVQFALGLPDGAVRQKKVLRDLLRKKLPRELADRPKRGFAVPVAAWLRGALRPWAEEYLDPSRLGREGYLHANEVQRIWQQHLLGRYDWSAALWTILMFETWLEATKVREVVV